MRVAIFAETYLPYLSGVTVSTEALARGLGGRGHEVLLVAPRPASGREIGTAGASGPEPDYAWLPSYQLPRLAPAGYRMPLPAMPWRREVERRVTSFAPEVVHAQSPFVSGLLARRAAASARAPLVFTHHTRFGDYRHYLGPLALPGASLTDAFLRRFWAACDAIVAPSSDLADEIRARSGGLGPLLVRAIPTGVDLDAIRALPVTDPRAALGWPPDAVVAVALGRLAPEKSAELLLEAFAMAAPFQEALRLLVIGDGPSAGRLRRRAARDDLDERVAFTGSLPRTEALARAGGGDLFLFASRTETQGLVLAEALALGLPVIALDGPGVRDSVRSDRDGIVVASGGGPRAEAERLAQALAGLTVDRERRSAMADAAREGAGRFDVRRRLREVEELYVEVRGGG